MGNSVVMWQNTKSKSSEIIKGHDHDHEHENHDHNHGEIINDYVDEIERNLAIGHDKFSFPRHNHQHNHPQQQQRYVRENPTFRINTTFYRVKHLLADWVGLTLIWDVPRLVGRYCSCLLPKQAGETPQIKVSRSARRCVTL